MSESKQALVTGVTSGIGRAVVERLVGEGYRVVGCGRRKDRLEELENKLGENFWGVACDLRKPESIEALFSQINNEWGGIDVLVNNAGLGHHSPLLTGSFSHWKEILDVNVLALSCCSKLAVEQMRQRGDDGSIIHISSMSGHRVTQSGMYSASKFAVRALTEGLRLELRELGSNIRVGAISPGFVETEFAEHYHKSAEKAREAYDRFPVIQSKDIAEQVVFMLKQPSHVQIHDILVRPTQQPS